jgi:hypothetical protein
MSTLSRLLIGIFGLAIGIAVGVSIGVFLRPFPRSIDVLSFTEAAFGIMVAFLAIIGAFVAVFQLSNFESRLRETRESAEGIARQAGEETFRALWTQDAGPKASRLEQEFKKELGRLEQEFKKELGRLEQEFSNSQDSTTIRIPPRRHTHN